ncbi:hypothetical protein TWF694_008053 [Orbilia ellipsospora]|uniref:Uncharacterized protein n=1 Tax=Orbilia ellipsospora TaxID=2528407 RepID=A0AAV9XFX5_9PEZI
MHRNLSVSLTFIAAIASTAAASCLADNCLRAIRASAFPTRPGTLDCISYFNRTVTANTLLTVTQTVHASTTATANITITITIDPPTLTINEKRDATASPTDIPAYASPCSGLSRYSSACSCIGITPVTRIVTPSTVVTVTVSDLITVQTNTITLTATSCYFQLTDNISTFSNQYLASRTADSLIVPTPSLSNATVMIIHPDGSTTGNGNLIVGRISGYGGPQRYLGFITPVSPLPTGLSSVTCSIAANTVVTCNTLGYTEWVAYGLDGDMRLWQAGSSYGPPLWIGPLHIIALPVPH